MNDCHRLFSIFSGKAYNLGSIKRGPVKEGSNIYLKYEDGDDCGNSGKKYSSQIHMQCGIKQVRNNLQLLYEVEQNTVIWQWFYHSITEFVF